MSRSRPRLSGTRDAGDTGDGQGREETPAQHTVHVELPPPALERSRPKSPLSPDAGTEGSRARRAAAAWALNSEAPAPHSARHSCGGSPDPPDEGRAPGWLGKAWPHRKRSSRTFCPVTEPSLQDNLTSLDAPLRCRDGGGPAFPRLPSTTRSLRCTHGDPDQLKRRTQSARESGDSRGLLHT